LEQQPRGAGPNGLNSQRISLPVWGTLAEALRVYRLLFRRSVSVAAVVYAGIAIVTLGRHATSGLLAHAIAVVVFLLGLAGPIVVQGALVEIVRNIHDGRPPERIGALFGVSRMHFWSLLGASLLYALGIFGGLILLIIAGLLVAARWSLMAPSIVLEGRKVGDAQKRSRALVASQTRPVLACVILLYVLSALVLPVFWLTQLGVVSSVLLSFAWNTLTAPLEAHALTVIYYRLADPDRPVIDPVVMTWTSVWKAR
jgi:hypothetical protein